MHYYSFNIGDYLSHTTRISDLEDLAYRRILDLYYLHERPLNGCSTDVAEDIGMSDYLPEVSRVLGKFFIEKNGEWINKRCEKEIKIYRGKRKMASKAGKASGVARKKKPNGRSTDVQHTLSNSSTDDQPNKKQETVNNNQELVTKKNTGRMERPTSAQLFDEFFGRVDQPQQEAESFLNHYESNGWKVGKNPMKSWKHAVTNWITRSKSNGSSRQPYKTKSQLADEAAIEALRGL